MTYRLLVMIVAIVLILLLLLGFWITARLFLRRYGQSGAAGPGDFEEQVTRLMAWTFAGFGLGLVFVGIGGPILGTVAFARSARSLTDVDWATAILWGAISCGLNALIVGGALVALVLNQ